MRAFFVALVLVVTCGAFAGPNPQKVKVPPPGGTVIVQPAETHIDKGAVQVDIPKSEVNYPLEFLKGLLPALIAFGASLYGAKLGAATVLKSLDKQLDNSKAIEKQRQEYETDKRVLSEKFAADLQKEKQKAEDDAKKLFVRINDRQQRVDALNLLLGRIHTYQSLGLAWRQAFSVYSSWALSKDIAKEVFWEAERKYKDAKAAGQAYAADVIAAAEGYGQFPVQVDEHEGHLSDHMSLWTRKFEEICADHRSPDDVLTSSCGTMAADVRALRNYELEIKDAELHGKEIPPFESTQDGLIMRALVMLLK